MQQFLRMTNMLSGRRRHQTQPSDRLEAARTTAVTTIRKPLGITIPEGNGEERWRYQEELVPQHVEDRSDPLGKRPVGEMKKKK